MAFAEKWFGPISHLRVRGLPGLIPGCRRKTSENALARLRYRATDSILPAPTDSVSSTARQTGWNESTASNCHGICESVLPSSRPPKPLSSVIGLFEVGNGGVGGLDSASFEDD